MVFCWGYESRDMGVCPFHLSTCYLGGAMLGSPPLKPMTSGARADFLAVLELDEGSEIYNSTSCLVDCAPFLDMSFGIGRKQKGFQFPTHPTKKDARCRFCFSHGNPLGISLSSNCSCPQTQAPKHTSSLKSDWKLGPRYVLTPFQRCGMWCSLFNFLGRHISGVSKKLGLCFADPLGKRAMPLPSTDQIV